MKSQLKTINGAYEKLYFVFDTCWTNHAETLRKKCLEEERDHRKSGSDFAAYHPDAISANQCAKLFAVKRVAEFLAGQAMPRGRDYLHCHRSCFIAAGMVDEFGEQIRAAWKDFDLAELSALDYCHFVKVLPMKGETHGN